jgi:hypothetical protein
VTVGRVVIGGTKCRSATECEGEGLCVGERWRIATGSRIFHGDRWRDSAMRECACERDIGLYYCSDVAGDNVIYFRKV